MSQIVPASTSIRRSRVHNIDTDRLQRRREFLRQQLVVERGRAIERRRQFAERAGELAKIEDELERRESLPGSRITLAWRR